MEQKVLHNSNHIKCFINLVSPVKNYDYERHPKLKKGVREYIYTVISEHVFQNHISTFTK